MEIVAMPLFGRGGSVTSVDKAISLPNLDDPFGKHPLGLFDRNRVIGALNVSAEDGTATQEIDPVFRR